MANKRAYYEELLKNENIIAWLNTIASCEGANYDTIVTYKKASNLNDHPRVYVPSVNSDAAGRYQFLSTTWDSYKQYVGAKDFGRHNQDLVAVVLIDIKNNALKEALRGDIRGTLNKISYEWASLPPFRYGGQGVCSFEDVEKKFNSYKGKALPNADAPLTGDYAGSSQSPLPSSDGILSAALTGNNCDPPPYNTADRIIYTGCPSKITSARPAGTGYPYPAPGMGILDKGGDPSLGMSPIKFTPIPGGFINPTKGIFTSPYGWRDGRNHNGVDIANDTGTIIIASADGTVIQVGDTGGGFGNQIDLQHPNGWVTRYAHLSYIGVSMNQKVKQGQPLGKMGSTGRSTGPHLHFELRTRPGYGMSGSVDPEKYIKLR